jgi:hypothetical protein
VFARSALFGKLEHATFRFEQSLDRKGLRDRVLSMSAVAVRPPAERARLLARIDQLYDEAATADYLLLPYETRAFRTARMT